MNKILELMRKLSKPAISFVGLLILVSPTTILGQEEEDSAEEGYGTLEEIVVTASRRGGTDITITPVSMTAITGTDIERYSSRDLRDIALMVPNLSAATVSAFNSASFAMRGVAETTIILYKEAPVGVVIDDFFIPHLQTQNLEMFDIEQIEVLRGPQGTLFGKNTTAGVITVRTKKPEMDASYTDIKLEVGDFGRKDLEFALNAALSDTLAFRFSGQVLDSDGYYKSGYTWGPLPAATGPNEGWSGHGGGRSIGGDDVFSARAKLLWEPSDTVSALFQYEIIRDNSDSPPIVNDSPPNYYFSYWGWGANTGDRLDVAGYFERADDASLLKIKDGHQVDIDGIYMNLDIDLGDWTLHSVTGRREQESRLPSNYTGTNGPVSLFDATRDDDRETIQQEIRLNSNFDGPLNFVIGGFYQSDKTKFCVLQLVGFLDFFGLGTPPNYFNDNPLILCNAQDTKARAIFADGTYDISDRLHFTAGLRQTREEKSWVGRPRVAVQLLGGSFDPAFTYKELGEPINAADFDRFSTGVVRDSEDWSEPTYRAVLGYDLNDEWFGFASYAHGFKSGGYNDQIGTQLNPITPLAARPVDPETADSYELGLKGRSSDGRWYVAANYFSVTYKDAQRTLNAVFPTGQETLFFNAAELEADGLELEFSVMATDALTFRGSYASLDSTFNRFEADTNFDGVIDVDLSGNPVQRAPENQFMLEALYQSPGLSNGGSLDWNLRVSYEDDQVASYSAAGSEFDTMLKAKSLVDMNITYTDPQDRYYVSLIGRNLGDKRYVQGSLSVATLWVMAAYGAPRYLGVQFGTRLGR